MISIRFATPVLALLALAAVPTVIHSYADTAVSDGRAARAIPMRLAGEVGADTDRRAGWGGDRFSSNDWIERRYSGGQEVRLFVGRSFDAKTLYHHPELAVDYGQNYEYATTTRLPQRNDVPLHVLRNSRGRLALYALHHGGRYIDDPIRFQLRTSFQLLFSRRSPTTLFFAVQDFRVGGGIESSRAVPLLFAALEAFENQ